MDNIKTEISDYYLYPKDAAALIIEYDDYYLLQLRDNKSDIFFPNKFGLFGGAINKNESSRDCVLREIKEELNLNLKDNRISYVTNVSFEVKTIVINRYIYKTKLNEREFNSIKLCEGQKVEKLCKDSLLNCNLAPYDYLALWIYLSSSRLKV